MTEYYVKCPSCNGEDNSMTYFCNACRELRFVPAPAIPDATGDALERARAMGIGTSVLTLHVPDFYEFSAHANWSGKDGMLHMRSCCEHTPLAAITEALRQAEGQV